MPTNTRIDAKRIVRESYLATLGAVQLVIDTAKELSDSATRYAKGGRSSLDSTVRDLVSRGEKVDRTLRDSDIAKLTERQRKFARTQAKAVGEQTVTAVSTIREAVAGSYGSGRSVAKAAPTKQASSKPASTRSSAKESSRPAGSAGQAAPAGSAGQSAPAGSAGQSAPAGSAGQPAREAS